MVAVVDHEHGDRRAVDDLCQPPLAFAQIRIEAVTQTFTLGATDDGCRFVRKPADPVILGISHNEIFSAGLEQADGRLDRCAGADDQCGWKVAGSGEGSQGAEELIAIVAADDRQLKIGITVIQLLDHCFHCSERPDFSAVGQQANCLGQGFPSSWFKVKKQDTHGV